MSNRILNSSLSRKVLMALSGFFLMVFLIQHFTINFLSLISQNLFNNVSHFMGTNFLVQFILQPVLMCGVVFHLIMGMYLDRKNRSARPINYAMESPSNNSSWVSRNMIITGVMIMLFLGLHFYDFWIPEIKIKYIDGDMSGLHNGEFRYWHELNHKFHDIYRVVIYCVAFVFLSLHLMHGFQSSFQTAGINHSKYTPIIKLIGFTYAIVIPLGFIFIAIYHHLFSVTLL
tara:strand:+ start:17706 stop:18395 length:690 start_codon:yes stop_codon:yes gene_type:complete